MPTSPVGLNRRLGQPNRRPVRPAIRSCRRPAIRAVAEHADALARKPATTIDALLGVVGRSAAVYFQSWHELPIAWKGLGRHPIPADWLRIGPRSSARKQASNRFASHPVHAMLNYAYALLEGQIRDRADQSRVRCHDWIFAQYAAWAALVGPRPIGARSHSGGSNHPEVCKGADVLAR